jgi:transcriptional regulator with XRE-family HTH domain
MKIHEKIRQAREAKELSQGQMAEKLGMSLNGYGRIELGKTDIKNSKLEKIAQALGIDPLELIASGEKKLFYIGDNCQIGDITNYQTNDKNIQNFLLKKEVEKLQSIIQSKDKELSYLQEIIALLKQKNYSD